MAVRAFCLWKRASQSFAAEAAKSNEVMFGRGEYVPEHTAQAASVSLSAAGGQRDAQQTANAFVEKGGAPFSTSSEDT